MKQVFIIHGWGGSSEKDWIPWAKRVLVQKGFEVHIPTMPDTDNPVIDKWVGHLAKEIGEIDKDTVLIGHSIGCQTILRYLEGFSTGSRIGKVILIAPWVSLKNLTSEEEPIARPWEETQINFDSLKSKAGSYVAVFSDDDPVVPYEENIKVFKEKLGAQIISKHKMGHFSQDEGITEIPFLLDLIGTSYQ